MGMDKVQGANKPDTTGQANSAGSDSADKSGFMGALGSAVDGVTEFVSEKAGRIKSSTTQFLDTSGDKVKRKITEAKAVGNMGSYVFSPESRMPYNSSTDRPKSTSDTTSYNFRGAKIGLVTVTQRVQISEHTPGGKASIKITYGAHGGVGRASGNGVEGNHIDTKKQLPGQTANNTTAFGETIFTANQVGGETRIQLQCENMGEAKKLAAEIKDNSTENALKAFGSGVFNTKHFDKQLQGFAKDNAIFCQQTGKDVVVSYTPYKASAYFSASGKDGVDILRRGDDAPLNRMTPEFGKKQSGATPASNNAGKTAEAAVGGYAAASGSLTAKATYSQDTPTKGNHFFEGDFDTSAPEAFVVRGGVNSKVTALGSLGTIAKGKVFGGSVDIGHGKTYDAQGKPMQTVGFLEGKVSRLDESHANQFRDFRVSTNVNKSRSRTDNIPSVRNVTLGTSQAGTSDLKFNDGIVRMQVRNDVHDTPQETLKAAARSDIDGTPMETRIEQINKRTPSSPFTKEWASNARQDLEKNVTQGPVDDKQWNRFLHSGLSPDHKTISIGASRLADWQERNFTSEHKAAYEEGWIKSSEKALKTETDRIDKLPETELHAEYQKKGMKYPGVYMRFYKAESSENRDFVGQAFNKAPDKNNVQAPSAEKSNAPKPHAMKTGYGLYKGVRVEEHTTYEKVGAFSSTHKGWNKAVELMNNKQAGPALMEISDSEAFPAIDKNGKKIVPSPSERLMYDGVTPTKELAELEKMTGIKRDYSQNPGILVAGQDTSWAGIGGQAREHMGEHGLTDNKSLSNSDLGQMIKDANFSGLSESEIEEQLFEGAPLVLPGLTPQSGAQYVNGKWLQTGGPAGGGFPNNM